VCRYNWHSAGSAALAFSDAKIKLYFFKYNIRKQFYQTALENCCGWFEITKMLTAVKKTQFIASFIYFNFSAHFRPLLQTTLFVQNRV